MSTTATSPSEPVDLDEITRALDATNGDPNAVVIANAPAWLRALVAEARRLRADVLCPHGVIWLTCDKCPIARGAQYLEQEQTIHEFHEMAVQAEADAAALRKALERYGQHSSPCIFAICVHKALGTPERCREAHHRHEESCRCGLDEAKRI